MAKRKRISLDTTSWAGSRNDLANDPAEARVAVVSGQGTRLASRAETSAPVLLLDSLPAPRARSPRIVESLGAFETVATAFVVSVFLAAAICL